MLDLQAIRTRWNAIRTAFQFKSLSIGIVIAMCAGLLLPAVIGIISLNHLRQEKTNTDIELYLNDKIALLSNSLALPVWNYDINLANKIAQASLQDRQVVRITISDAKHDPYSIWNIQSEISVRYTPRGMS